MKHAGPAALDRLAPLIEAARASGALKEKSRGVFYLRSRAYLHFHEDPAGLFADVRAAAGAGFDRLKVDEPAGRAELLKRLSQVAADSPQVGERTGGDNRHRPEPRPARPTASRPPHDGEEDAS